MAFHVFIIILLSFFYWTTHLRLSVHGKLLSRNWIYAINGCYCHPSTCEHKSLNATAYAILLKNIFRRCVANCFLWQVVAELQTSVGPPDVRGGSPGAAAMCGTGEVEESEEGWRKKLGFRKPGRPRFWLAKGVMWAVRSNQTVKRATRTSWPNRPRQGEMEGWAK